MTTKEESALPDDQQSHNSGRRNFIVGVGAAATLGASGIAGGASNADTGSVEAVKSTEGWTGDDAFFGPAYIDADEWRDAPVRYRYVHGGFTGTDTRFAFYFPPAERYRGRMLQFLQGQTGGDEHTTIGPANFISSLQLPFDCGAYLVESNQGHLGTDLSGLKGEASVGCWRATAQAARFSKIVARAVYGAAPHHSYLYGGSGGGVRTLNSLEHVEGVWDGAVPFVMPHQSQGTFFSLQSNVVRLLGLDNIDRIADATEVGGSGDPYAGLNNEQALALATLYKTGWPRASSLRGSQEAILVWTFFAWLFEQYDPGYFKDFWTRPGYLGHDLPGSLAADRAQFRSRVRRVLTAGELAEYETPLHTADRFGMGQGIRAWARRYPAHSPVGIILEGNAESLGKCSGATMTLLNGAAAGRKQLFIGVYGDALLGAAIGGKVFDGVMPGDEVTVDNSDYLAYCHWHRHHVEPEFAEWSHSVVDGKTIYPQRGRIMERLFSANYTFRPRARKIIIVQNLLDRGTWPCGAPHYLSNVARQLGADYVARNMRVWYVEHAMHYNASLLQKGNTDVPAPVTTLIDYEGCVEQAVRDLIAWVEQDKEPPPSSNYEYTRDSRIILAPDAATRGGIQPVITLTGNGRADRLEIKAGTRVDFTVVAEVPPGAGTLVSTEWDYDGRGTYPFRHDDVDGKSTKLTLHSSHVYDRPGTYFATVRVSAQRDGRGDEKLYRATNLGRIRVVVG